MVDGLPIDRRTAFITFDWTDSILGFRVTFPCCLVGASGRMRSPLA